MSKAKRSPQRRSADPRPGGLLSRPLLLVLGGALLIGLALFALWKTGGLGNPAGDAASSPVGSEVGGTPRLEVDREKVDLGDVPVDQTVSVTFLLSNTGDGTLSFSKEPYIEVVEGC